MFSVIIPTYNRASYLKEMVVSIENMADVQVEIIISDDCSSDQTLIVVKELQDIYNNIRYIRNEKNMGCGYSRRKAYLESKGEYIVFADDDDYYTDSLFFVNAQSILDRYPTLSFCGGNVDKLYMQDGRVERQMNVYCGFYQGKDFLEEAFLNNGKPISTFSAVFRKSILEKVDFQNMEMMNDVPIYMRSVLYGDVYLISDTIGIYRIHNANISDNLTSKFIIKNLDEKYWVKLMADRLNLQLSNEWLFNNYISTINYYFRRNKYTISDIIHLYIWGKRHSLNVDRYFLTRLKSRIRKKMNK